MFNINNEEIGTFVSSLIEEKYGSARKFCRRCHTKYGKPFIPNQKRNKSDPGL